MSRPSFYEITDPQTGKTFFANLQTGECSWELPADARLQPRDPSGTEWWELFDESHKLPYYFNTRTKQTEWVRPTTGTVIPVVAIQNSAIGKRLSVSFATASMAQIQQQLQQQQRSSTSSMNHARMATPPKEGPGSPFSDAVAGTPPKDMSSSLRDMHVGTPPKDSPARSVFGQPAQGSFESMASGQQPLQSGEASPGLVRSVPNLAAAQSARTNGISGPVSNPEAAQAMHPLSKANMQSTQSMSLPALQSLRTLPPNLLQDISQFKIDGFAKKYFSEHRRGIFRRKVPVEKMLLYQKDALRMPLMQLRPSLQKDAIKCFKILQKIMNPKYDFMGVFPDIQELLEKGVRVGGLRDEIFVQICKQLTKNPSHESVYRGWQLLDIVASTFPPSKNFENYLKNFIQEHFDQDGPGSKLDLIIRHAASSLARTSKTGPRGRTMTFAEINQVLEAPFKSSVFGDTLDGIMDRQSKAIPNMDLPRILLFLSDAILNLNGCKTEGIFRVPGDAEAVSDLRCRIDKDEYDYTGINDPNVPSSLLKLWLRELADPLIPAEYYGQCVQVGQEDGRASLHELYQSATQIVESLPDVNRKIVAEPQNQPVTKMTVANIAMVFAPNFLRCPSDNPATIFENTKFEQAFLRILIVGGKPMQGAGSTHASAVSGSPAKQVASDAADPGAQPPADIAAFVEDVLRQLQTKFEDMSKQIITRMDDMSSRLDDLEKSLGDMVQEKPDGPSTRSGAGSQSSGPSQS
ncbi:hypothetical protein HK105_204259 [Polyrhizophydium stewartii]|uniref:Uncharacterized protein n=1 Tax=Polyrhizophydium stewartii TaxID=2732419 RepID=A0ABR4N9F8_9FUNG